MKCAFPNEDKECNIRCIHYHTCTRSEYKQKEGKEDGNKKNS